MSFDFHIDKLDEILVASDNKQSIKFNVDIIPDLIAIACDTMRGIVFEKNKGTILEKFILPLRDYKSDMGKHKKK